MGQWRAPGWRILDIVGVSGNIFDAVEHADDASSLDFGNVLVFFA